MKFVLPILLALFPFLHDEAYEVTLSTCEPNHIIVEKDGSSFEVTLFNLKIKEEESWNQVCSTLKNAKRIQIEIDSSSAVREPVPVYLFADEVLIQELLIRENKAYTLIHNPEYTYEKKLLEIEQSNQTMAQEEDGTTAYPYEAEGWKFLLFLFFSWIIVLSYGLYKNDKFPFQKH